MLLAPFPKPPLCALLGVWLPNNYPGKDRSSWIFSQPVQHTSCSSGRRCGHLGVSRIVCSPLGGLRLRKGCCEYWQGLKLQVEKWSSRTEDADLPYRPGACYFAGKIRAFSLLTGLENLIILAVWLGCVFSSSTAV